MTHNRRRPLPPSKTLHSPLRLQICLGLAFRQNSMQPRSKTKSRLLNWRRSSPKLKLGSSHCDPVLLRCRLAVRVGVQALLLSKLGSPLRRLRQPRPSQLRNLRPKRTVQRVRHNPEVLVDTVPGGFSEFRFTAMNTTVSVTLPLQPDDVRRVAETTVLPQFFESEQECSRFLPGNALSVVNRQLNHETRTSAPLYEAIEAAHEAYQETDGLFDPRILSDLTELGYDTSFERISGSRGSSRSQPRPSLPHWTPTFRRNTDDYFVNIGEYPIDLGGIVKGRTVDQVAASLQERSRSGLVNAGGDIHAWGRNPKGKPWLVGVEHPRHPENADPIAVVALSSGALATSSIRKRSWRTEQHTAAHHLIDPRSGRPAETGLRSVTVSHALTQLAEVCAKVLFIAGEERIRDLAASLGVEALWVHDDGALNWTDGFSESIVWRAS